MNDPCGVASRSIVDLDEHWKAVEAEDARRVGASRDLDHRIAQQKFALGYPSIPIQKRRES